MEAVAQSSLRGCLSCGVIQVAGNVQACSNSLAQGMHGNFSWTWLALLLCCVVQDCIPATASSAAPAPALAQHDAQTSAGHAEDGEAVDALAFFVIALLLGIFTTHLLSWTRVPYTALLLVRQCLQQPIGRT